MGTTDDPADSLEWHAKIRQDGKTAARVLPSFRPDRVLAIENPGFAGYIGTLARASGRNIATPRDLLAALEDRIAFFDTLGCRASDHGLDNLPFRIGGEGRESGEGAWERELEDSFAGALEGKTPRAEQVESWKTFMLTRLAAAYHDRGWAMQIHIAALRNVNSRALG